MADRDQDLTTPQRLAKAVRQADQFLQVARDQRREALDVLYGPRHKGQPGFITGLNVRTPSNVLFMIAASLRPALSLSGFRASVSARSMEHRGFGDRFGRVIDRRLEEIGALEPVNMAVFDGLSMFGVVKVSEDMDRGLEVVNIDPADYVIDPRARFHSDPRKSFEGHRFMVDYEMAMDGEIADFTKEARDIIEHMATNLRKSQRDNMDMLHGSFTTEIELVELYLPKDNKVVWMPSNESPDVKEAFLLEQAWEGHEKGPFSLLRYFTTPDNILPVPLLVLMHDLHLLQNRVVSNIGTDAVMKKTIGNFKTADKSDVEKVRQARHGDFTAINADYEEARIGGVDDRDYPVIAFLQDLTNKMTGNHELVGGMASQSKTLGQDQMLMANANVRIADMKESVLRLATDVVQKVGWYLWHGDYETDLTMKVGSVELSIPWTSEDRPGELEDYDMKLAASAVGLHDPDDKINRLSDWMQRFAMPLAEMAAQTGSHLDYDTITNLAANWYGFEEAEDIWVEGEPMDIDAPSGPPAEQNARPMSRGVAKDPMNDLAVASMEGRDA